MNSKNVLDKIISMLSSDKKVVEMTYAKLADGTIVESATFDVGETLDIVSEDGTKSPAPNGTHELALRDSEGKDVLIKVVTEEGKIVERENVELPAAEEAEIEIEMETEEVAPLTEDTDKATEEMPTEEVDMKSVVEKLQYRIEELEKKMKMVEEEKVSEGEKAETDKVEPISEMSLPKLDGAPVEDSPAQRVSKFGKTVKTSQGSVLSKLYK